MSSSIPKYLNSSAYISGKIPGMSISSLTLASHLNVCSLTSNFNAYNHFINSYNNRILLYICKLGASTKR